jgi:hypothetical protein
MHFSAGIAPPEESAAEIGSAVIRHIFACCEWGECMFERLERLSFLFFLVFMCCLVSIDLGMVTVIRLDFNIQYISIAVLNGGSVEDSID